MKAKTLGLLLPLAGLAMAGLTSCGGSNDSTALNIGLECGYAPFNWTEGSENEYTLPIYNQPGKFADGYDIQIAKHLSRDLGREVRIFATDWLSLVPDLQTGAIDLVIAGMTDTAERRESIAFTNEYYHSELVLVVANSVAATYEGQTLNSTDFGALVSGQVVVSQNETVTDEMIDIFKNAYGAIHAQPVSTFALAATDVANGSAFAMTAELPVAKAIVSSNSNLGILHIEQTILGESYADLGVSIGIRKTDTALAEQINASLAKIDDATRLQMMEAAVARSSEE